MISLFVEKGLMIFQKVLFIMIPLDLVLVIYSFMLFFLVSKHLFCCHLYSFKSQFFQDFRYLFFSPLLLQISFKRVSLMNGVLLQRIIFVFSGSCFSTIKQSDVLDNCRFHLDYHCFVRVQLIADLLEKFFIRMFCLLT